MIIEAIVTTLNEQGDANFAPMGVTIGDGEILIRPYKESADRKSVV